MLDTMGVICYVGVIIYYGLKGSVFIGGYGNRVSFICSSPLGARGVSVSDILWHLVPLILSENVLSQSECIQNPLIFPFENENEFLIMFLSKDTYIIYV